MTLSFSTQINGDPTYFVEKIWEGLRNHDLYKDERNQFQNDFGNAIMNASSVSKVPVCGLPFDEVKPKLHTIREDKSNRWKAGNYIHFVINNRSKNRFQFAPVIKCLSVQKIRILWDDEEPCVYLWKSDNVGFMPFAYSGYNEKGLLNLAQNDGFESIDDFFKWFDSDFTGKIIHWTDLKY